jgi:hypothetical protein
LGVYRRMVAYIDASGRRGTADRFSGADGNEKPAEPEAAQPVSLFAPPGAWATNASCAGFHRS